MKVMVRSALWAGMLAGLSLAPHSASSANVSLNGQVRPGTCSLQAGEAGKTILMPTMYQAEIQPESGRVDASRTDFSLELINCSGVVRVALNFSGSSAPGHPDQYASPVQGMALHLEDASTGEVLAATGKEVVQPVVGGALSYRARAYYYRMPGALGGGAMTAATTVMLAYQ